MLTTNEAAQMLKVSPSRVRQLILVGSLPATKHGRDWMIKQDDIYPLYDRKKAGRPKKGEKQ